MVELKSGQPEPLDIPLCQLHLFNFFCIITMFSSIGVLITLSLVDLMPLIQGSPIIPLSRQFLTTGGVG